MRHSNIRGAMLLSTISAIAWLFFNCFEKYSVFENGMKSEEDKLKVLIIAYPRTGSTLLGESLTRFTNMTFFFEPMAVIKPEYHENIAPAVLTKLYACDSLIVNLEMRRTPINNKKLQQCRRQSGIVVKTIRLRFSTILTWLQNNARIKVIHLVRDPRALVYSIQKLSFENKSFEYYCDRMLEDLYWRKFLSQHRYKMVKYEDLASNLVEVLKDIYYFAGINFTRDVEARVKTFQALEQIGTPGNKTPDGKMIGGSYTVFKKSDFNFEHWKTEISDELLRRGTEKCRDVLETLNYTISIIRKN